MRTLNYGFSEDVTLVQLRALRWTYPEIARAMPGRSPRSLQSRYSRLKAENRLDGIRVAIIRGGAVS